jgi:hypothetical protein
MIRATAKERIVTILSHLERHQVRSAKFGQINCNGDVPIAGRTLSMVRTPSLPLSEPLFENLAPAALLIWISAFPALKDEGAFV